MTTTRPTIGNTYAIGRFNPNGPEGYAPVYNDGTHGPTYATRDEAEADYTRTTTPPPVWTVTTEGDPDHPNNLYPYALRERGEIRDHLSVEFIAQCMADRNNDPDRDNGTYTQAIRNASAQYIAINGGEVADIDEWTDADVMHEVLRIHRQSMTA